MKKLFFTLLFFVSLFARGQELIFPSDAGVINMVEEYGCRGDGSFDNTDRINQAIADYYPGGWYILYFPKGEYLVTDQIKWPDSSPWNQGPVLQGQDQEETIIRLANNATGYSGDGKAVIRTPRGVAQKFNMGIRNMTIHTGSGNPGAIGMQFMGNNESIIRNVTVTSDNGDGKIGIDFSFTDENGPLLVDGVTVEGFDIGFKVGFAINSMTFKNILLKNQKEVGISNTRNVISIHQLRSENSVPVVQNDGNNGTCTIVDATLTGGASSATAILNNGIMYLRDINASGYGTTLESTSAQAATIDGAIDEYYSHASNSLFDSPDQSLQLPIKEVPEVPYDTDLSNWVNVQDFGAVPGDGADDSEAIQQAIDAGGTTVYFPKTGGDFSVYDIEGEIRIRGSVERLIGCSAWTKGTGSFIVEEGSAPTVVFERIRRLNASSNVSIVQNSSRNLIIESAIIDGLVGNGTGDVFLLDMLTRMELNNPDLHVWGWHVNLEDEDPINVINDGATLWLLGVKTEKNGTIVATKNGGRTEVLGGHIYAQCREKNNPMFIVEDANLTLAAVRETQYCSAPYEEYVVETRDGTTRVLERTEANAPGAGSGRGMAFFSGYSESALEETPDEPGSSGCSSPTNLALGQPVTASGAQTGNPVSNVVDGTDNTDNNRWSARGFSQWAEIDLGQAYPISRVAIVPYRERGYQFIVQTKRRATDDYRTVVDRQNNEAGNTEELEAVFADTARFVRIEVTGCSGSNCSPYDWVSLREVKVFGCSDSATARKASVSSKKQQLSTLGDLLVYPNPATSGIFHVTNLPAVTPVTITNVQGRLVLQEVLQEGSVIDLSDQPNGVYLLHTATGEYLKLVK